MDTGIKSKCKRKRAETAKCLRLALSSPSPKRNAGKLHLIHDWCVGVNLLRGSAVRSEVTVLMKSHIQDTEPLDSARLRDGDPAWAEPSSGSPQSSDVLISERRRLCRVLGGEERGSTLQLNGARVLSPLVLLVFSSANESEVGSDPMERKPGGYHVGHNTQAHTHLSNGVEHCAPGFEA
ncbi:hypothetical protein EYF80_021059 [Liparis tanakae]|uniref:Uncharacterized protein n=1 Tax=Liparis tanakae TaxID=230148 RepID=A0A4Z2HSQ9_9TELE|nr:hypothetical protein EYF80_021059 [Liparis tanakae]